MIIEQGCLTLKIFKIIILFLTLCLETNAKRENILGPSQIPLFQPVSRGNIIRACDDVFNFSNVQFCISVARNSAAIYACAEAFPFDNARKTCVRSASNDQVVFTCEDEFLTDHSVLKCISSAQDVDHIIACKDRFITTSDQLRCLRGR